MVKMFASFITFNIVYKSRDYISQDKEIIVIQIENGKIFYFWFLLALS